jgi:hypothetical protein
MEHDNSLERDLAHALRRLNDAATVPPVDPAREAALLAAFDSAQGAVQLRGRRDYWYLSAFAAAAIVLIAVGVGPASTGRHGPPPGARTAAQQPAPPPRDVRLAPPSEFVIVPGADALPRMESGTLVRMDVPVSMLPSLGVTPPQELQLRLITSRATVVKADFIVGQDGLPRAVRLVN